MQLNTIFICMLFCLFELTKICNPIWLLYSRCTLVKLSVDYICRFKPFLMSLLKGLKEVDPPPIPFFFFMKYILKSCPINIIQMTSDYTQVLYTILYLNDLGYNINFSDSGTKSWSQTVFLPG